MVMEPLTPHHLSLTLKPHFIPAAGYVVEIYYFLISIVKSEIKILLDLISSRLVS